MKIIAETTRLVLREFVMEDAPDVLELHRDPEVIRYTGDRIEDTLEGNQKIISDVWLKEYAQYGHARWAVILKSEQKFVGWCGLKWEKDLKAVDLGYRFLKDYWGNGIATESAAASLRYGFENLGLDPILALAMKENPASTHVMKKIGMHYFQNAPFPGVEGDLIWYKITKEQYFKQNK